MTKFKALLVSETADKQYAREIVERSVDDLPEGEVLIRVRYSSLNYKDALSASGNRGVTRRYPHTPGIDAAGEVAASDSDRFSPGDKVLCCCYNLGMNKPGGFGQYIRVPEAWVMPCPEGLSLKEAMMYGTGGFTAALSVEKLMAGGVSPEDGKVLVTGATGGVGSLSVAILAKSGFTVVAASGKSDQTEFFQSLGAAEVVGREAVTDKKGMVLLKTKWAGVIDTVGGEMLATALKSVKYGGVVTCCGNVASPELPTTVYPFILRGVSLVGIEAAECDMATRERVWGKLADQWRIAGVENMVAEIGLAELPEQIELMLAGGHRGRIVVNLDR
ncbi:MAG: YhdH/YhfP family quinone oxidoreductase [Desulfobulbaceae bacterium]|nr:YhdH/YhfP family quinone oxidoreductase [Desulfobulbaceae bacterium]